jgi:hypothetical protein
MLARTVVSKKCATCPIFLAGKCKSNGAPQNRGRRLVTEAQGSQPRVNPGVPSSAPS